MVFVCNNALSVTKVLVVHIWFLFADAFSSLDSMTSSNRMV